MLPLPELVRHVRRRRVLLDMTQAELAREAGTSQSLIAKLERGRINPAYETVRQVLEALDRCSQEEEAQAGDLMQKDPVWAEPDERLAGALARMKTGGFSQLPVVADGIPVGALSETAILQRIDAGADLEALKRQPVSMAMGEGFPTVRPATRRRALLELLREHEAVLVMHDGRMVGVVTKSDLW